jgi:ABC-type anion transport system duplicated permease subunit
MTVLITFFMLLSVTAHNLVQTFLGWEGVEVASQFSVFVCNPPNREMTMTTMSIKTMTTEMTTPQQANVEQYQQH